MKYSVKAICIRQFYLNSPIYIRKGEIVIVDCINTPIKPEDTSYIIKSLDGEIIGRFIGEYYFKHYFKDIQELREEKINEIFN
jgi:hypothetical protein